MSVPVVSGLRALAEATGLVAREPRSLLRVTGTDRTSFLQGMLSANVLRLGGGQHAPALFLTAQGRIVAPCEVLIEADSVLLDVAAEQAAALGKGLEAFVVADDVEIEETGERAALVGGPLARETLARVLGAVVEALPAGSHVVTAGPGGRLRVVRGISASVGDWRLWGPGESIDAVCAALHQVGASDVGPEASEIARILRGLPRAGVDWDESTLAPEVPAFAAAIAGDKGCYLGQEVVERVAARGRVNWLVLPFALEQPAATGTALLVKGEAVGELTSVARSPVDGAVAARARARRSAVDEGAEFEVAGGGRARPLALHS